MWYAYVVPANVTHAHMHNATDCILFTVICGVYVVCVCCSGQLYTCAHAQCHCLQKKSGNALNTACVGLAAIVCICILYMTIHLANNTVYTPYIYMVLANPRHVLHNALALGYYSTLNTRALWHFQHLGTIAL
jgi:hypothetical protein